MATTVTAFPASAGLHQLMRTENLLWSFTFGDLIHLQPKSGTHNSQFTADQLAQVVEYWATAWEVVGSDPGRTNTQGLQITE